MYLSIFPHLSVIRLFYSISLVRKLHAALITVERASFTLGSIFFQVKMRKLIFISVGGLCVKQHYGTNNLNQTYTFVSKITNNKFKMTCHVQFNIGFAK